MKHKNNEGSSLLEVVIAMAILAAVVIPVCSSLILSHRMNAKTEAVLQAQLDVAAAVEYYMAVGIPDDTEITGEDEDYSEETAEDTEKTVDRFPAVTVRITDIINAEPDEVNEILCYEVTFSSETGKTVDGKFVPDVTVETTIRAVKEAQTETETETQTQKEPGKEGILVEG